MGGRKGKCVSVRVGLARGSVHERERERESLGGNRERGQVEERV